MAKMANNQCLTVAEKHCATWPDNVIVLLSTENNVLDSGFSAKAEFY